MMDSSNTKKFLYVDVDNTLIRKSLDYERDFKEGKLINIHLGDGVIVRYLPVYENILKVKRHFEKGYYIVHLWSQAGQEYAKCVAESLYRYKLLERGTFSMYLSKPDVVLDDIPTFEQMGIPNIYFDEKTFTDNDLEILKEHIKKSFPR